MTAPRRKGESSPRRQGASRDAPSRLVVVGASAGGVQALRALAAELPADFPCALLVVLHVGAHPSILPRLLSRSGALSATHAVDGEPYRPGHIHVAPPDHHLLVDGARLRLARGPKEHHARPAIDPLFRSAALAHGPGVVGVVLTGRLDDGTAGLQAIKAGGGITVVQDPADAIEPSMPASALRHVQVDHCVPLAGIGALLDSLVRTDVAPRAAAPEIEVASTMTHEHALSLSLGDPMQHLQAIAAPSPFVCPDCSGGLSVGDRRREPAALSLPHRACVHAAHFGACAGRSHRRSGMGSFARAAGAGDAAARDARRLACARRRCRHRAGGAAIAASHAAGRSPALPARTGARSGRVKPQRRWLRVSCPSARRETARPSAWPSARATA